MNKRIGIGIIMAAMALGTQWVSAQGVGGIFKTNDLYLGFNNSSAASDYIIDLGQASNLTNATSVVDLSSLFSQSTFASVFTSGANGVNMAVVGGNPNFGNYDIYVTQLRAGGAGNAGVAGSDLTGLGHSQGAIGGAVQALTAPTDWPTAGTGTNVTSKSYTSAVGPAINSTDFVSKSGVGASAFGTIDGSGIIYEDLWFATVNNAYSYKGYFKLDVSGATPHLTFTPASAAVVVPPAPRIVSVTRSGNTSTIFFTTTNGTFTYTLYFTNAAGLAAPVSTWSTAPTTVTGNGLTNSITDTTTDANRFYRVGVH